jgi:uncharacterized caspase-like protein
MTHDDMASALKRLGFDVILKKNATQQDMEDAIRNFGDRLKRGGVFEFTVGGQGAAPRSRVTNGRALPVHSGK